MEVCKAVNTSLIPDMSREIYKWVFVDSLNIIGEYKKHDNAFDRLLDEREVIIFSIKNSKFICQSLLEIINNRHLHLYLKKDNIVKLLSTMPQPIFNNETEKLQHTQEIIGLLSYLIDICAEKDKLYVKREALELRCYICDHKILSLKIINCKTCGIQCDKINCCTACIPEWYLDGVDPYLCDLCNY